jgi:hypothetical protein
MGKLIFHYLPNLYVDESEAGSASHIVHHRFRNEGAVTRAGRMRFIRL